MNLIKYKPLTTGLRTWDFDRFFGNFFSDDFFSQPVKTPKVNVREEDKAYILEAELPGLTDKDIEVKLDNDVLSISSIKKEESKEKHEDTTVHQRRSQAFSRSFTLPQDVNKEAIEASFKNGLLVLVLNKSPEAQPKQIEVKST